MRQDRLGPVEQDDVSYYHSRVVQENTAAANASCEAARRCHDELAVRYALREGILRLRPNDPDRAAIAAGMRETIETSPTR